MSSSLTDDRLFEEGDALEVQDLWAEDEMPDAEPAAQGSKSRGNKYGARRHIERYWELKALRSHLDEFDTVDPEF